MAETCIVCLGDLNVSDADPPPPLSGDDGEPPEPSQGLGADGHGVHPPPAAGKAAATTEETVAHLLPCGHNLHNECLRPWVERANSCPICRANFNMVELKDAIGGPVINSYPVQDKQQVAEIDPSMIVEEEDIENDDPCMVCEDYGNEAELLICDGCEAMCHVFCAGLDSVPIGYWLCQNCMQNPEVVGNFQRDLDSRERHSREQRRQRTQRRNNQRRQSSRAARSSGAWARVWQSVWQRIHLDLDFPFDDEEETSERERTQAQRRELQSWERRLRVAARQGAGDRFRQTAPALLDQPTSRPRPPPPDPESQEELRAWNAFDKAREAHETPSTVPNRRKRKSATASPSEPQTEPERALKRPRTRRTEDIDTNGESSASAALRVEPELPLSRRRNRHPGLTTPRATPGFLQSLLNEVETTATVTEAPAPLDLQNQSSTMPDLVPFGERPTSPHLSSPGASPTASNHPTPRANTPPPLAIARPTSPSLLSSSVLPIYPPAPEFAPFSPADDDHDTKIRPIPRTINHSSPKHRSPSNSPPPSRAANSPNQSSPSALSFSTKSEIQKMVKSALKPHYAIKEMSKDEFTDICRDICRMLYDRVAGDKDGGIRDETGRAKWQRIAIAEVEKALADLRTAHDEQPGEPANGHANDASDSSSNSNDNTDDMDGTTPSTIDKGKGRADDPSTSRPILGPTPVPAVVRKPTATVVGAAAE